MLQATVIGNVGADAQYQSKDGREFTTWRVAHNDSWTDQSGQQHNNTIWVDCIMNGRPKVAEFIKAGTQVVCIGRVSLRTYSSQKDRCMKAGMTIQVESIQLLGGSSDEVPRRLYDDHGVQHDVTKFYKTDVKSTSLMSQRGDLYTVDSKGWITLFLPHQQQPAGDASNQQTKDANGYDGY